jgi:membrane-associated phospholipid phosphatase
MNGEIITHFGSSVAGTLHEGELCARAGRLVPDRIMVSTANHVVNGRAAPTQGAGSGGLRVSEESALVFFAYTAAACWFFPLSLGARLAIFTLNTVAAGVLVLLARVAHGEKSLLPALRDWLPCVLIVLAYRESGLFIQPDATHHLDHLFIVWDRALLGSAWFQSLVAFGSPWLGRFMELAYLLVYPFIPLGCAAVYFAKRKSASERPAAIDRYWTAVLLAVLVSYALFPFFPLTPPRVLFHDFPGGTADSVLRQLNSWVLGRYSVQACIFPSGHVAGAVATALAVRAERPRLGIVFVFAAAMIAASTFYGRYHYGADAAAGALVGVAAFIAARSLSHRSAQAPANSQQSS